MRENHAEIEDLGQKLAHESAKAEQLERALVQANKDIQQLRIGIWIILDNRRGELLSLMKASQQVIAKAERYLSY